MIGNPISREHTVFVDVKFLKVSLIHFYFHFETILIKRV